VTHLIRKWSDDTDARLLDCFANTDWNMFRDSSNCIEEYTTSVTGFMNKCIDDFVPTVTVRTHPNQKQWITGNIRTKQKARSANFKERETIPDGYKKSRYAIRQTINRQSVNTGLRLNPTTLALMLVRCGRACKLLQTTKGKPAASCPVTQA
jgi:hypothetical protein